MFLDNFDLLNVRKKDPNDPKNVWMIFNESFYDVLFFRVRPHDEENLLASSRPKFFQPFILQNSLISFIS